MAIGGMGAGMMPSGASGLKAAGWNAVRMGRMIDQREIDRSTDTDSSLLDWFLALSPTERLAELESRIAFFEEARSSGDDSKLQANTRAP
jgi:hypothetical protein